MLELDDRYLITRRIGRGGVGEVFEGVQVALDRPVAIKLLRPELTVRTEVVHRFEQEARTTCRLHHPNVVTVFDVGVAPNGARFLVMELLVGKTLAQALRERRFDLPETLAVAAQLARGMGAGQGVGLVHRDLKPENIFLLDDGQVKILDFGLALLHQGLTEGDTGLVREVSLDEVTADLSADMTWDHSLAGLPSVSGDEEPDSSGGRLTRPGALVGTPRYMSPEQALCWSVDHRADLYAFGCILYEMVTGEAPFEGLDVQDYLQLHVHQEPTPPSELAPGLPPELEALVLQLLQKDPNARPRDWAEVSERMRRIRGRDEGSASGATPRTEERKPNEPYRFLQPFSSATRAVFFGREGDARSFRGLWEHPDQVPLLALIGSSGVGKTSFVAARAVPGLEDTGHAVLRVRGGSSPTQELAAIASRHLARASGSTPDVVPLPRMLDQLGELWQRPIAVVIDQLEELFTSGTEADQAVFQADISAVIAGGERGTRFLLSIREDFHGALVRTLHPLPLDELMRTLSLRPLQAEDIAEALEGPARGGAMVDYATFSYEPGLVARIVADLLADEGPVAPRVQVVGHRLWEMRQAEVILASAYDERLGGARGILGRVLDDAIEDQPVADRGLAKELLRALTRLPGSATSAPAPETALVGAHADSEQRSRVLQRLESPWRLVQGYADPRWTGQRAYRLAHEALIARIKEYGEEDSERNRARQIFLQGLDLWVRNGEQDQDLLVEAHFDVVQRHAYSLVLRSGDARSFYARCRQVHSENWWRREQRARWLRRWGTFLRWAPVAAGLALGFVGGQALVGFRNFHTAEVKLMSLVGMERAPLAGEELSLARLDGLVLLAPDLRGADLRYASLRGADLQQADFTHAHLGGTDLAGAVLQGADFTGAELDHANFRGADLRQANLDTDIAGARFEGARFDLGTSWQAGPPLGAVGPGGDASGSNLDGMNFDDLDLYQMVFHDASLEGVSLVRATLQEARLHRARMAGANLAGADLRRAELIHTDLRGADLGRARLISARLATADLRGASLVGADMTGAVLDGVRLQGAFADTATKWPAGFDPTLAGVVLLSGDLRDLNLAGAPLSGALMQGANLDGVDLRGATLVNANLSDASLQDALLEEARLTGAILDGANLCGADLRGAELSGTSFAGAIVCDSTRFSPGHRPLGL